MNTFQTQPQKQIHSKKNTKESQREEFDTMCTRTCEPHHQTSHNGNTPSHTIDLLNCNTDPKNALPEILFGGCNHSLWIAITSRHVHNPRKSTQNHRQPSQNDPNWIIHSMAKHTTNTSPTIIQRSRHSHAIGFATSGSNPTALTIETSNLRYLQQPHRNWRTLTSAHQEKLSHKPSKNWPEMLLWFRNFEHTKKCLIRTVSNAHTLRNGIGGVQSTTSRHAQRHGYRVSKSDRIFIRQSLTIHTWTIKTREETIHLTSYQIESPLTQIVTSHLTFRLKLRVVTKLYVPGTMCFSRRPFQNK